MPIFGTDMETTRIGGSGFGFSAKRVDTLGASEYTEVVLVADVSGSVNRFSQEIEKCVKSVVAACRLSPRADNLLLRVVLFSDGVEELHGFKPLTDCHEADYDGQIHPMGGTALYDATFNGVESARLYAKALDNQDFTANAIVVVITDGDDNSSAMTPNQVREAFEAAVESEALESILTILVGVNVTNPTLSAYLADYKAKAKFDQYVEIDRADAKSLAKLAQFVSKSISATSQALGTGGASKPLTF
jgi:uncharacterized protein YegL